MTGRDDILVEITPQVLLKAYAVGIFPMAESAEDPSLFWIEPETRGVIPLRAFHVPKRLRRTLASDWFEVRIDSRTMLPRRLDMVAAAHFMHHAYSGFNAPRRIFAPR